MSLERYMGVAIGILFCLFGILILVATIGTAVQEFSGLNKHWVEEGDCFDRFSNKIEGLTCEIDKSCSTYFVSILSRCEGGE